MALTANSNFYFKMKALNFLTWRRIRREDLEGKIHFEHFPSLSFGPSQCHNSVNIGSNSTSRDSFVICRSRALIWHQDCWYFLMFCWRNQLLKFWPSLYLTYCIYRSFYPEASLSSMNLAPSPSPLSASLSVQEW